VEYGIGAGAAKLMVVSEQPSANVGNMDRFIVNRFGHLCFAKIQARGTAGKVIFIEIIPQHSYPVTG